MGWIHQEVMEVAAVLLHPMALVVEEGEEVLRHLLAVVAEEVVRRPWVVMAAVLAHGPLMVVVELVEHSAEVMAAQHWPVKLGEEVHLVMAEEAVLEPMYLDSVVEVGPGLWMAEEVGLTIDAGQ